MVMYCDICGAKIENGDVVNECPECLCSFENVDKNSPIKEFKSKIPDGNIVKKISTDDSFMNAMIKLYNENLIEYQLKIQQFKTQLQQQENNNAQNDNKPRCPKCGSTNIQIVPRKWSLLTGFLTNKTDRVCVNCKHKF